MIRNSILNHRTWFFPAVVAGALLAGGPVGCQRGPDPAAATGHNHGEHKHAAKDAREVEKQIEAALAQLSQEDRTLALAQRYCAVTEGRLGEMGPPLKLTVKDQPVFLCCKGCKKKAEADPDKTLAKVEELKAKAKAGGEDKK
ncbi:MAG TPA: hypothetical protein PKC45_08245 [Gemmatales bacterium]|nr:hypothetical protein [Gemmatales bacterium]